MVRGEVIPRSDLSMPGVRSSPHGQDAVGLICIWGDTTQLRPFF